MIRIHTQVGTKIPRNITVACSGGADSIAITHFLAVKHNVTVAYFNHGNDFDNMSEEWLYEWCKNNSINFVTSKITRQKHKNESNEEYWRNERYEWFHSLDNIIVTAHHLDDCIETWIWSSLNGEAKIIPYSNRNVIRPFRTNKKQELVEWCDKNNVSYLTDPSNQDTRHMRNYIRNNMMDHVLHVNPGISKVIRKKIIELLNF
jgi:tRNA(Ile)-lysidine synthase